MEKYIRWRFSSRAGELLVLDPHLLDGEPDTVRRVIGFLNRLNRPIRALAGGIRDDALAELKAASKLEARVLPGGRADLHDRVWIVGPLVGTSVNLFVRDPKATGARTTTAADLPVADSALWRAKFEYWWARGRPL